MGSCRTSTCRPDIPKFPLLTAHVTLWLRLFSDHGMTFAFDNRAKSGFARGEGVGVLIIKPLHRAVQDNDKIRSVIVSTGVGQDGRTVGKLEVSKLGVSLFLFPIFSIHLSHTHISLV